MKAARAALAANPGTADAMRADWRKEARFLAGWGITQGQFRHGVPELPDSGTELLPSFQDRLAETRAREDAVLPGSGGWT